MALITQGTAIKKGVTKGTAIKKAVSKGTVIWTDSVDFATASWGQIAQIAASGKAPQTFGVGDEKTITLTTGENITLVILGFGHDDLTAGGKAPITIGMKDLLATKYRYNSSTISNYSTAEINTTTLPLIFSQLPTDLQAVIKQIDKKYYVSTGGSPTTLNNVKLFLFAGIEIQGSFSSKNADGTHYDYYYWGGGTRIKKLSNGTGEVSAWTLRTNGTTSGQVYAFSTTGVAFQLSATTANGVCFGFCI